ncbi:MAG: RcpC/CpaB family pilus assembly protein [Planctomycetota bacterium]
MSQTPPPIYSPPTPGVPGNGDPNAARGSAKLLIVAVILAVAAVVLVNLYVAASRRSVQSDEFVVFRMDVQKSPGDVLAAADTSPVRVPMSLRESFAGAVAPNAAGDAPARVGDPLTRPVEPGDILEARHFDLQTQDETRLLIRPGMRGIAIPVQSQSLPDPIRPEMMVDIEAPFRGRGGRLRVMPVMEMVRVVAVGTTNIVDERRGSGAGSGVSKITLEVTPQHASDLEFILSQVAGEFRVHTRNPADTERPKIGGPGVNPEVMKLLTES